MSSYELTFLVEDKKEADKVKELITSLKGKIQEEKHWGTQALAYPINKHTSADYYTYQLTIDETELPQLKQKLNFNENIIRHLILTKE